MRLKALLGILLVTTSTSARDCVNELRWTTSNGKILVNGQPFVLKGINYFGFETENFAPHGIWTRSLDEFLDFIKDNNFNAIRVPFSMEMVRNNPVIKGVHCGVNSDLCGLTALQMLDEFIERAADRGLLIMLDNHRNAVGGETSPPLWYDSSYREAQVIDLWSHLVSRTRRHWNVFAIDLKNEPHDAATWGDSNRATDWNKAAERMINGLSTFQGLFFVGGIEWGNRLEGARRYPIDTGNAVLNRRVVYAPHSYGPDVYNRTEFTARNFPENLDQFYTDQYGFLAEKGHAVVVAEWGGMAQPGTIDEKWNKWFVEWLRRKCLTNNFYWCLNENSRHTGGLLESDWRTPVQRKLTLVNRAQPNPTKFEQQSNGQICIQRGSYPEARC